MAVIDIDALLGPVAEEQPCGENLEYDPAFVALETEARGTAEQQIGDAVVAAEEPNWTAVRSQSLELFEKTKDLRVAAYLTRALANVDGPAGLCDGLTLVRQLVEQQWDNVHPLLDPDDDYDPTLRVNTLESLSDDETMVADVRRVPLVSVKALGSFSLRDIAVATGVLEVAADEEAGPAPDMALIDGAFIECDLEELQSTADAVSGAVEQAQAIESVVGGFVGATEGPNLGGLQTILKEIQPVLAERLAARGVAVEGFEIEGAAGETGQAVSGEITSNADVKRMLDKICHYFDKNEPSSPVPLLLQRAKRLVDKDFMEILQDLTPDGVSQAQMIAGTDGEEEYE